jgi:ABC-2 type transport system permease protein
MNIYFHELKSTYKNALIWIISIIGLTLFLTVFYPTFSKEIDDFVIMLNNFPEAIRIAFGLDPDTIGTILGYYAFMMTFVYICASIQAIIMGLSNLSKEIREKTADFLLSKPISRSKIVTSKIMASLTIIFLSNVIYLIVFYLILLSFADKAFVFNTYFLLTLATLFLQLIFFALGTILSVIIPKIKTVLPMSLGIVFGVYLLSTFTGDKLECFMPFKYFEVTEILLKNQYELKYMIITIIFIFLSICATYIIYKKKDIPAV